MSEVFATVRRAHALAISFGAFALGVISVAHDVAWLCAIACVAACLLPELAHGQTGSKNFSQLLAVAAVIGMCAATLALRVQEHPPFGVLDGRHVEVRCVALERARDVEAGASLRVRIESTVAPTTAAARSLRGIVALLEVPRIDRAASIVGNELIVRGRVDVPRGPRNAGERAEREVLADEGIAIVLRVHSSTDVIVRGDAAGWFAWWARLRARFADVIEARMAPLSATVLEGILWGDRGNLPAALRQEFSDTGTVHVLTTAGLHVGMMIALVLRLLALTGLQRGARAAIVIAAAWAYAMLAGLHLPTIRAATMLTAGLIAQESGRDRTPSAILACAAFAVCLPHPLALLSPSFAMSFACVGGIALLNPALRGIGFDERLGLPKIASELLRTSCSVQIAMWPLQALYFNAITPYAIIANVAVVPLVGIVMACGSLAIVTGIAVPALAAPVANITSWLVTILTGIVERVANWPHAHVDAPPPNAVFFISYWLALGAFAYAATMKLTRRAIAAGSGVACVALGLAYSAPGVAAALDRHLYVDAIDVGQADCILIRAPGMHAMLVDGGGRLERSASGGVVAQPIGDRIAAKTVLPFLLRHWVTHLDAIVLTHPHGDHAGGLPTILARERVDALYDSAQVYGGPAYHRALDVVRERHVAWRRAVRGETFDLGPTAHVKILAPELPLIAGTSSDINNNSVVLRIAFGPKTLLLTGDAQSEAEARLLSHGDAELRADILKVGHHGSAYSSTQQFLAAVGPSIAIISCGRHNVFGHPSPKTLAALTAAGARVFRTDTDGGVSCRVGADGILCTGTVHRWERLGVSEYHS